MQVRRGYHKTGPVGDDEASQVSNNAESSLAVCNEAQKPAKLGPSVCNTDD